MARKRYGGFSDPEPEIEEKVEKPIDETTEEPTYTINESEQNEKAEGTIEPDETVPAEEITETKDPIIFDEEKVSEPLTNAISEPMESIEAEVGEEATLEVPVSALKKKVTITTNALNIRTGPGGSYQAVGITKKGSVHKVLEEQDGWGRIGDNKWINLSKRFVEKD